jgi:hypothetical protein
MSTLLRKPQRKYIGAAVLLILVASAVAIGAFAAPSSAHPASIARKATCHKTVTVFGAEYFSHVQPWTVSPAPNGCWPWNDTRASSSNPFWVCAYTAQYNGGASLLVYDDVSTSHTSPTDNTRMTTCWGSANPYLEYIACGGGSPVRSPSYILRETANYGCSGATQTSTQGGMIDITGLSGSTLTSQVLAACNLANNPGVFGIYAGAAVSSADQSNINSALNSCAN